VRICELWSELATFVVEIYFFVNRCLKVRMNTGKSKLNMVRNENRQQNNNVGNDEQGFMQVTCVIVRIVRSRRSQWVWHVVRMEETRMFWTFRFCYDRERKMAVFWVVASCNLVEVYQRFRGPYCLHHQGDGWLVALMMKASRTSETLVNFCQTTRRYNSEDGNLHTHRRENLEFYMTELV
jgi:hypothetical protein